MPGTYSWKWWGKVVRACGWKVSSRTRSLRGQLWAVISPWISCARRCQMGDEWVVFFSVVRRRLCKSSDRIVGCQNGKRGLTRPCFSDCFPCFVEGCRCCTKFRQLSTGSVVINAMLPRRGCPKALGKTKQRTDALYNTSKTPEGRSATLKVQFVFFLFFFIFSFFSFFYFLIFSFLKTFFCC